MSADRQIRLWGLVVEYAGVRPVALEHVCTALIAAAGVDCAGVSLRLTETHPETMYASDDLAARLEETTLTLGEGPGVDAVNGCPSLVADLAEPESMTSWPVFAPAAVELGIRAMFALPLRVGAIHLGVLSLYRTAPGGLSRDQLADALQLVDVACAVVLDAPQSDFPITDGHRFERVGAGQPEVHQATGMITIQLGVSASEALVRLRAYAYANDRRLLDVARDVVARRLRFAREPDGSH